MALAAGIQTVIGDIHPPQARRIYPFVVRFGSTAALIIFTAAPLRALYTHNPKEVPVDLRSAYHYVLSRATANDLVVGFGDTKFWSDGWFPIIAPYYLRHSAVIKEVITTGSMSYAAIPFRERDHAAGKLFAMVPSQPELQTKIREAAADQYDTTCWDHICVLQSRGQRPVSEAFDDFCGRFEF